MIEWMVEYEGQKLTFGHENGIHAIELYCSNWVVETNIARLPDYLSKKNSILYWRIKGEKEWRKYAGD